MSLLSHSCMSLVDLHWTGGVYERLADPGGMGIVGVNRFRALSDASGWKKRLWLWFVTAR